MIRITCTSCKNVMEIDDAFAGGVCRCQRCGTIQTVAAKGAAAKTATAAKASKTLFENKARSAGIGSGSGLDDLADIVASSSGLSDTRLRKKPASPPPQSPTKNLLLLLAGAAGAILVLVIVVLALVLRGGSNSKQQTTDVIPPAPPAPTFINSGPSAPPPLAGPNFCGTSIDQDVVVYLIDNGSSSDEVLDSMKSAVFKSIESLGSDRRFQILFWNPDTKSYPTGPQTAFAIKDNIDVARKKLDDVMALGSTDPLHALKNAVADNPGEIILITAKGGDLDDSLVEQVMTTRGNSTARIDCIAINGQPGDTALARIAAKTGGKFVPLPEAQLKAFAY
jgi:hypothetical protein